MLTMGLALLLFLPLIILLLLHHFMLTSPGPLPPGPSSFYALTYLSQLIHKPHRALRNLSRTYGPLMSFRLGTQLIVVASSPEVAKDFFLTHDRVFSGQHLATLYNSLPGIMRSSILFAPDCSNSWRALRSTAQVSLFSSMAMAASAWIRKAKVKNLVDHLRAREGCVAELGDLLFATLANVLSASLMSKDLFEFEGHARDDYKATIGLVNEIVDKITTLGVVDFLPTLKGVDFWSKGKAIDIHCKIKRTWSGIIDGRRPMPQHEDGEEDFLDIVLGDHAFSNDQIGNVLTELLIGATDSTTITSIWLIVELMQNQEMLLRVRREIENAAEGEELNEARLSECHYFEACIKETLRLHVPVPLLVPHRALETCKVHDYTIPKDSMVFVNAWAIARDPMYWEDAASFKPERFLLSSRIGYRGSHFEYLPFGTGLRMCPGLNMAFKNIEMLVGSLLHHFDWSLPSGTAIDTAEKYSTTLKKAQPLLLVPVARNLL